MANETSYLNSSAGTQTASRKNGTKNEPITDVFVKSFMKEPFSGSSNKAYVFKEKMDGFVISNDGAADLKFMIGRKVITVKAGETFSETFSPFTKVTVFTTVPFRAYGLNSIEEVEDTTTLLASDDFERVSASGLGKTKEGLDWVTYGSTSPTTTWKIASGKAVTTGTSFQTAFVDTGMPDFYSVEADITLAGGGNASNYGGLMISHPDSGNALFFRTEGSDNTIRLYIATAPAVYAILKSSPFTFTDGQTVKFKVTRQGNAIEIFADGVSVLTHTMTDADASRTTSTKQGLFLKSTQGAADNFKVEILGV